MSDPVTCPCGSAWFQLRRTPSDLPGSGAVSLDSRGIVIAYEGDPVCIACGEVWVAQRERLRLAPDPNDTSGTRPIDLDVTDAAAVLGLEKKTARDASLDRLASRRARGISTTDNAKKPLRIARNVRRASESTVALEDLPSPPPRQPPR